MLDFNGLTKKYLTIKLFDGQIINIKAPTKAIYTALINLQSGLNSDDNTLLFDKMYELSAKILSCNLENKEISVAYVESNFDISDIVYFIKNYADFAKEVTNNPN